MIGRLAAVGFVGTVVAANYATSSLGLVPVGFGLEVTAGTFAAGLAFVLRDTAQDELGRRGVLVLIALGALLSFVLASPIVAVASAAAFAVSELVDLSVYTPLRRRGYLRAAVASNLAGALVDTALFLAIAGFPVWSGLPGQMLVKAGVTALVVLGVVSIRLRPARA